MIEPCFEPPRFSNGPQLWPPIPEGAETELVKQPTPEERAYLSCAIIREESILCMKTIGSLARQMALLQQSDRDAIKVAVPQLRALLTSLDISVKGMEESVKNL